MFLQSIALEEGVKFGNLLKEVPKNKEAPVGSPVRLDCAVRLGVMTRKNEPCINGAGSRDDRIEPSNEWVRNTIQESETVKVFVNKSEMDQKSVVLLFVAILISGPNITNNALDNFDRRF